MINRTLAQAEHEMVRVLALRVTLVQAGTNRLLATAKGIVVDAEVFSVLEVIGGEDGVGVFISNEGWAVRQGSGAVQAVDENWNLGRNIALLDEAGSLRGEIGFL